MKHVGSYAKATRQIAPIVAIYLPDLSGGGAERLHVLLAPMLERCGYAPRLLLDRAGGAFFAETKGRIPIDILNAPRQLVALPKLVLYLKQTRPAVLLANTEHMNITAILAAKVSRSGTAVVATQHNSFSDQAARPSWQFRVLPTLYRHILSRANGIVAVSRGVADDLAARCGISSENIDVIHNGVVTDDFSARASGNAPHAWFADNRPIIMAMGRLVPQKDFATLINAFAALAGVSSLRLMILGDGPMRAELEQLAARHGLTDRIAFPGFVSNPLPWLKRASVFVLSSRFEGFGNVLCEALACGVPVVSTNCPYGPSEILEKGRFGRLVPVSDEKSMAAAIASTLQEPPDRAMLVDRGREFSVTVCAHAYARLFSRLISTDLPAFGISKPEGMTN